MDDDRHFIMLGSQNDRNSDKTAFGKDDIRFVFFHKLASLKVSFQNAKRI